MSKHDPHLITTYSFQGRDYLVKMTLNDCLELEITDKQTGEQWECTYDTSYIENLTRKTGNFKHFDIFTTMLRSGLLKTSECITLDLLSYDDLESLRSRKFKKSPHLSAMNNNRRYLIVTYSVEFDRINYPLPLEYCGFPDPIILQATIKRLEGDLMKANEKLMRKTKSHDTHQIKALQNRIEELVLDNERLDEKVKAMSKTYYRKPKQHVEVEVLQKAIAKLEKNVISERNAHNRLVEKLQSDKVYLTHEVDKLKISEKALQVKLLNLPKATLRPNNSKIGCSKEILPSKPLNSNLLKRAPSPTIKPTKEPIKPHRSRSTSPACSFPRKLNERLESNRSKSVESNSSIESTQYFYTKDLHLNLSSMGSPNSQRSSRSRSNKRRLRKSRTRKATSPTEYQDAVNEVKQFESHIRKLYRSSQTQTF